MMFVTDQLNSLLQKLYLPISFILLMVSGYVFYSAVNADYFVSNKLAGIKAFDNSSEKTKNVDYSVIADWMLLGSVSTSPVKQDNTPVAVEESQLPLELIGVIHSADEQESVAIIKTDQQHRLYRVDDVLPGDARIVNINKKQVIFSRSGKSELLKLKKFQPRSGDIGTYNDVITQQYASRAEPDDWD